MTIGFDTSILLGWYQSQAGLGGGLTSSGSSAKQVAPTPPWRQPAASTGGGSSTSGAASKAVQDALLGRNVIDENSAKLDLPGASADYKKLFALYNGLGTLSGLIDQIKAPGLSSFEQGEIAKAFQQGLSEVSSYTDGLRPQNFRLTRGQALASDTTTVGIPSNILPTYVTKPLVSGSSAGPVAAFQGNVQFDVNVVRAGLTHTATIDLSQMGAQPRTLANVAAYINAQLKAAGILTNFASQRIPGATQTVSVNGKDFALPAGPDQWALKVNIDSGEAVTFSAPATAGAVYVAQTAGDPNPDHDPSTKDSDAQSELLKFQTDTTNVAAPQQNLNDTNWVPGRVFESKMGPEVQTVHATQVAPDGSVYVLADVNATTSDGQTINGSQDAALIKYDASGQVVYTRTLGAAQSASGLALAVAADGKVAIAGSVTGGLDGAVTGPINSSTTTGFSGNTDSFVTLFDASGQEMWTQSRGALMDDKATSVSIGADGTVYVAGQTSSPVPGTAQIGGADGYLQAFKADAAGNVKALYSQSFGSTAADKPAGMVVNGQNIVVASNEGGHAVLRRFDVSSGTPILAATRDLGDLQGGSIAGLALDGTDVVLAGTTSNGALAGGTITRAASGGADVFAARMSADLSTGAGDTLAYYGGTGDEHATGMTAANGQVWVTGSTSTALPGQPPVGKTDGFVVQLDTASGAVNWSTRFTGKDRIAQPTAIAVDPQGASVLDQLGLPKGTLQTAASPMITANTSVRPGDQFQIRTSDGVVHKVTIANDDTLATLGDKIRRASGFDANVTTVTLNGMQQLRIEPQNGRNNLEILAGPPGQDALGALGLTPGIVRDTTTVKGKTMPSDGRSQIYGLDLPSDLNLNDKDSISHAAAEVAKAQVVIQSIYKDLVAAATPKSPASAITGTVPAYLTAQIASYQYALSRLTGGG